MVPVQVQPGDVLAGKYRVERVLGKGNMGVVVAASHVDLAQRVALKFMLPGAAAQPEHRERFLREARASVRLRSQHVARVLDVGTLDGETPYIVMELLEGHDLAHALSKGGPLPFPAAVEYVLQACEAVAEAHAAGVVHRDLKPANLFLTHDVGGAPCVKVLDFGISKSTGVDLTLTQDAQALGSPLYMSPEQMNSSRDVDARSDIWALGIVIYQLVAGVTPFHADTIQTLCARVLMGAPTPLAELRPDAPAGFEAVVLRCIDRDRNKRFQSVAELAAALAPYAPPTAAAYVQRVARVLGVAAPVVAQTSANSLSASAGAPAAGLSTIVMSSPAQAVTNSATGGLATPQLAASAAQIGPGIAGAPLAGSNAGLAGNSAQLAGSNAGLAGSGASLASSNAGLAGSGASLASSNVAVVTTQSAPAPSRGRGALIAAALGGALVVAAIAVALVRPWSTTTASPEASNTAVAALPTSTTPTVVPAATTLPTAAPTAEATATATAAITATPTTTAAAKPTAPVKPTGRLPTTPTSRPGVSYDDRR